MNASVFSQAVESIDISVIVPMYNVENLIIETLESISQNSCNFEVLIINDGATDQSLSRATEFSKKDERFKVISQKNQGVSVARNLGLSLAQGDFICFVDSDDILTPNALDKMLNAAQENKADFVYGAIKKFNSTKQWYLNGHIRQNIFMPGEKKLEKNPELVNFIGVGAKLIHRDLLRDKFFPINIKFSEDTVIIYQSYLKAKKIFTISEVVYLYRERDLDLNAASATQLTNVKAYPYLLDCFNSVKISKYETLKSNHLDEKSKNNIIRKFYDRFFAYEIWPFFLNILKHDKKNINKSLYAFLDFLESHSVEEINKISTFRFYLIKVLIDQAHHLSLINLNAYRNLMQFLFKNLNQEISDLCQKKSVYGEKWNDSYKIAFSRLDKSIVHFNIVRSKKYIFNKMKNDPQFIREKYFPLLSKLPIEKNKVVFATNRKKPMPSNFSAVYNEIKNKNYKIYKFLGETNSVKKIVSRYYHLATAEVIFLEDYYKPIYGLNFRDETKVVQLWHACGAFKKFSFAALEGDDSNSIELETSAHQMYTHVTVSSKKLVSIYAHSFNINENQILSTGIPRTDILFNKNRIIKTVNNVITKYPDFKNTINIVYAPTFRGNPSVRYRFNLNLDWNLISNLLPRNYKIIIKLHPVVKEVYPPIPDFVKDKVVLMPSAESIDDLMVFCDCLITDYSSVIFEYSLLDKPLILFPYDIDTYFDERGFYYPYDEYAYGETVYNTYELIQAIKNSRFNHHDFADKRKLFINQFMSACDGQSTKRLLKNVI